jgi:nitroimidazol reductase NimA-like FMN-containing flavoprotein (pyridoxamine 5'-phosphate oxidase superfamily)
MRNLHGDEIVELLAADVVARLATVDRAGYPHVTPIWFLWVDTTFYLTSYLGRPHLDRIRSNPRVGLVIDVEDEQRDDGERPNRQISVIGDAVVTSDSAGEWTRRIRRKYIAGVGPEALERGLGRERALITVVPNRIHAIASV